MNINLKDSTITWVDENMTKKQRLPLSTRFDEVEILDDGRILICEYYYRFDFNEKSNIYCLNRLLEIDWFLPLPNPNLQSDDIYVGFSTNGNRVFANSWNGFRVEIDTQTGNLKDIVFTK